MPSTLASAISASASALYAQKTRVEVAVSNLANADSTRGPNGEPYRRRDVALQSSDTDTFDKSLSGAVGVKVTGVVADQSPFQRRYEPGHPDADEDGWISLPNVDTSVEMADMMTASRAYQANLAAIGIIREMLQKALDLSR